MRSVRLGILPAALLLGVVALPARGQNVLDQQQNNGLDFIFSGTDQFWSAQTFRTSSSNISGAGFRLTEEGLTTSGQVTIDLWGAAPAPGGSPLAGGTVSFDLTGAGNTAFFDVFWSPVTVTPGQLYWLTLGGSPAGQGAFPMGDLSTDLYPDGVAYFNQGTDYETEPYYQYGNGDLDFHTYTDLTATPEPGSVTLLATGLVGLLGAGVKRRRRRP